MLTLTFAYETYYIILWHIFSIFLLLFVNCAIWLKAKKIPLLYAYLAVQGIILLWLVSKIFKTIAPNAGLKFFFVVCQYTGVCFLGEAFFIFAYLYAFRKMPAFRYIVLLSIPSAFFLSIVITNPWHYLFYSHFDFWGDSFGPVFYFHQAYSYILLLAGLSLCAKNFFRQFGEQRQQAFLFAVAILVPIAANILYLFDWFELIFRFEPPCDITPITCNISLMLFVLATFRYRFFDDIIIARREALGLIPDGILLLDENYRIADYNNTFRKMYENDELYALDSDGLIQERQVKQPLALYKKAEFISAGIKPEDRTYQTKNNRYHRSICKRITENGTVCGYALRFIDLTFKQKILNEVEQKNRKLTVANRKLEKQASVLKKLVFARTRNFIAGEVHDIMGHSVVLVISLLEVASLSFGKAAFDFNKCITQAEILLQDCLKKTHESILGQTGMFELQYSLIDKLNTLFNQVRPAAITVELFVAGNIVRLPKNYEDAVFKLCRESITNSIRHGRADKINVILRFRTDNIEIYIIDNGAGCSKIKKGIGITGMENRIRSLDGLLLYNSLGDQGFCVQAILPAI